MAEEKSDNSRRATDEGKSAVLQVRVSSLIGFIFIALVAIGMAYIGGVMSGRHMEMDRCPLPLTRQTESQIPQPEPDKPQTGNILSAEELEFARVLRNQKVQMPVKDPVVAETPVAQAVTPPAEITPASSAPTAAETVPSEEVKEKAQDGTIYDFVFQLGAFKDELSADRLRQQLEGEGLRTRLVRNGKLYLVRVMLRGSAERAAELRMAAEKLKLGSPLEIGRKPVEH